MGCPGGPLWRRVAYQLPPLPATDAAAPRNPLQQQQQQPGILTVSTAEGRSTSARVSVFDYLETQLALLHLCGCCSLDNPAAGSSATPTTSSLQQAAEQLPFDFWGGFVGYLGYELKSECGGRAAHVAETPDAAWFFADRVVAVDHRGAGGGDVYLLALHDEPGSSAADDTQHQQQPTAAAVDAAEWIAETTHLVQRLASSSGITTTSSSSSLPNGVHSKQHQRQPFALRDSRRRYVSNVAACQDALCAGESYELCLTTALTRPGPCLPHPWTFYKTLRRINPAPYAAWLRFSSGAAASSSIVESSTNGRRTSIEDDTRCGRDGRGASGSSSSSGSSGSGCGAVTVCCSSPERFLRGGRGGVLEAKPIKGTARRSPDPVTDAALAAELAGCEKERAENLMIVDLLRNDLGRVCEPGSVHVPGLIELESYTTVHQLVSTVRGLRRPAVSAVVAARSAFPGGSMTGAPKLRSMEILDRLEAAPRGVYSGSLGFFSVNDTFDLNIVIRTAVFAGGKVRVGAGGAVVVQSEPEAEYDEMRLKAAALLRAFEVAEGRVAAAAASGACGAAEPVVVVGEEDGDEDGDEEDGEEGEDVEAQQRVLEQTMNQLLVSREKQGQVAAVPAFVAC